MTQTPKETKNINPTIIHLCDSYKHGHLLQYPDDLTHLYVNFTPRAGRDSEDKGVIFFGLQYFLAEFDAIMRDTFFAVSWDILEATTREFYQDFYREEVPVVVLKKLLALHDKGCWQDVLVFNSVPEGTFVPYGVPCVTIHNADPNLAWFTTFIESWFSCEVWHSCTSATTAMKYRVAFQHYANLTSDQDFMVDFQGHDFSLRGHTSFLSGLKSGAAHCLSFKGSDTCGVLPFINRYYPGDNGVIATSVPATEHSVAMTSGQDEEATLRRFLTEVYPTGIFSFVSDTWDFWAIVTDVLPKLKNEIMNRDGKLVIRPDSGDPVLIMCGDPDAEVGSPEYKGLVEVLWGIFGGEINSKGFKQLDAHIGTIYGDSITLERQEQILSRLWLKQFSSTNVVLGIGSYTYQYVTRDTHGFAFKATAMLRQDSAKWEPIWKDPKTDSGSKKSARGLLAVIENEDGVLELHQDMQDNDSNYMLRTLLKPPVKESYATIRDRVLVHVDKEVKKLERVLNGKVTD